MLSYLQSSDVGTDLSADLKVLQESLLSKYGVQVYTDALSPNVPAADTLDVNNSVKRKVSVGYQEEKFASGRCVNI